MSKQEQNQQAIEKMAKEFKDLAKAAEIKDGELKVDGREIFESNLPEGVTPAIISDIQNHVVNTAVAAHQAIGEVAIAAMAKDKDLDAVKGTTDFGPIGNGVSYVSRVHKGRNPKTNEETVTPGSNRMSLNIFAPGGQRYNAAVTAIKGMAADKLKV